MADFLDVGGVKLETLAESWHEDRMEIGDVAEGADDLAMTGRVVMSRAAIVRKWTGTIPRDAMKKGAVAQASAPLGWERLIRWIEGWGVSIPGINSVMAGNGIALSPAANITNGAGGFTVSSGTAALLVTLYALGIRGGFSETNVNGWTFGFKKTFQAGETPFIAGVHWCVATGAVAYANAAAANPVGVTQYVDGAAANFNVGNITTNLNGNFQVWGKKTDNTNAAVVYSDLFYVPFQMPANWISQIYTNLIVPNYNFPVLPFQRLSGQWLTNEPSPVQAIGRVTGVQQRVGIPGTQTWQNDLRELAVVFQEA